MYVTGRIGTGPDTNPRDFNGNLVNGYGSDGSDDIFVAKLSSNGTQEWFKVAGGTNSNVGSSVSGVVVSNDSSVYVTGFIITSPGTNPRDFNGNPVNGYGSDDIFVAKLGNKKISVGIAKKNTCRCVVKTIISGKVPCYLVDNLEPYKTYYVTQDSPPVLTTNVTDNKIGVTDRKGRLYLL